VPCTQPSRIQPFPARPRPTCGSVRCSTSRSCALRPVGTPRGVLRSSELACRVAGRDGARMESV
jgi:hypothetical protein